MTNKGFYVYYTVNPPFTEKPTQFCAGPYTEDEVCVHRVDIAGYSGVSNVYVTRHPIHPVKPSEPLENVDQHHNWGGDH